MLNHASLISWVESYLFHPTTLFQKVLSHLLLPLSILYCAIVFFKRYSGERKKVSCGLPIISIGNLTIGGNGKTPLCIALAKEHEGVAIILRGYGRSTSGMMLVSHEGQIKCDVEASGDEAMLYAKALPHATVIVSEDRLKAIHYAQRLKCKIIFLDDAFSKSFIQKFDILIKPNPEPTNNFCLPSGPYREPRLMYKKADLVVREGIDFTRHVEVLNPTERMLLVTAISKPYRLDAYLPSNIIGKVTFKDHHLYTQKELKTLIDKHKATSILTTQKDAVKMVNFNIPLSILALEVKTTPIITQKINAFLALKR